MSGGTGGVGNNRNLSDPARSGQPLQPRDELIRRLEYVRDEGLRCLRVSERIGAWGMIWRPLLIVLGALVAAQGAVVKIYGDATWVTIMFIILGVVIAMASGFEAAIKPGQRSPKYTQVAFDYERLFQEKRQSLMRLEAEPNPEEVSATKVLNLLNDVEVKLTAIRTKELSLAVNGPLGIGEPRRSKWMRTKRRSKWITRLLKWITRASPQMDEDQTKPEPGSTD